MQVRCELVVLRNSRHSAQAVGGRPRFGTSCSGRSACLQEFWRWPRVQASHEYCVAEAQFLRGDNQLESGTPSSDVHTFTPSMSILGVAGPGEEPPEPLTEGSRLPS